MRTRLGSCYTTLFLCVYHLFYLTHVVFVCGAKNENFVENKMNWSEWELYKKGRWKKFQEDLFYQIVLCKFIDLGMDTMHETTFTLKNSIVREEVFSFFQNDMQENVRCKIIGDIYINRVFRIRLRKYMWNIPHSFYFNKIFP